MDNHNESEFVEHVACESCGSSDANSLYSDGHTYCFACNTRGGIEQSSSPSSNQTKPVSSGDWVKGTYQDLVKQFGALVADMVQELTTDKAASDAIGKGEYIANKMAKMSSWALVVKLADRLANVQDIDTRPAAFQKKYAADTRLALKRLRSDRFLSKTHNKIMTAIEKKIEEY